MKATIYPFITAAIILLFASCKSTNPRYISNPSVHNAAFLREKGDLKITGAFAANPTDLFSVDDKGNWEYNEDAQKNLGADGQIAYAFTDHFFMQGGFTYRNEKDVFQKDDILEENSKSKIFYDRTMFDIGAGYYTPLGSSRKIFFTGALGVGFGHSNSNDFGHPTERNRNYEFDFMKYYLTPSFNFFFTENARLAVAPRFSLMRANNIKTNYTQDEINSLGYSSLPDKSKVLFEPSVLFQAGIRNIPWMKFDVGFNFASNPLKTKETKEGNIVVVQNRELRSRRFLLSFGLSFYPFDSKYRRYN